MTYGDTLLDVDLGAAERTAARARLARRCMTVLHNQDRWEPSNVTRRRAARRRLRQGRAPGTHEYIDYGYLLSAAGTSTARRVQRVRSRATCSAPLIADRRLAAFAVHERFHDIGTPEALADTEAWLTTG